MVQLTIPEIFKKAIEESEGSIEILGELPSNITKEVIKHVKLSAENATKISANIIAYRERIRRLLNKQRVLRKYDQKYYIDLYNVSAVDGTYKVISTTMYDIIFVGAVSYSFREDGLRHEMHTLITPPSILSEKVARGLMVLMEFKLAAESIDQYDFVILDGSYIANLTNVSELITARKLHDDDPIWESRELLQVLKRISRRKIISKLLKNWQAIASPKKQTGKVLIRRYLNDMNLNSTDAAMLSLVLEPKEWVKISWIGRDFLLATKMYNTDITPMDAEFVKDFFNSKGLDIIYFKPKGWTRSYKVEIPGRVNDEKAQKILDLIYSQINNPLVEELELQYLADLMCSQLTKIAALLFVSTKNVMQQKFAKKWINILFTATRYRTQ